MDNREEPPRVFHRMRLDAGSSLTRRELFGVLSIGALASLDSGCTSANETTSSPLEAELHFASLSEVASLVESRAISPVELTDALLERIESIDPHLMSYTTVMADRARESARRAEQQILEGDYRGPLHGVPVSAKDLFYTRGVRTMAGSSVFRDFVPDYDATAVARLERAGAVMLGKTNLTEGANIGYHPDFQIPVNPWREDLWPGASSSGSGVAVAAGLCYASLGTDTGGSIRAPSNANGVVGLKPTYGRVSRHGVFPLAETLDHVGPMTRTVEDAAIVLQCIAGADPEDPTTLEAPVPNMLDELSRGVQGVRIGIDEPYLTEGVEPDVAGAILTAVDVLRDLGARVVEVELPAFPQQLVNAQQAIMEFEAARAHRETYPSRAEEYGPYFRELLARGSSIPETDYAKATQQRNEYSSSLRAVFETIDVVAIPALPLSPFPLAKEPQYGSTAELVGALQSVFVEKNVNLPRLYTAHANLAGVPTLCLPCGSTQEGLPLTIQFMGGPLAEPMLCRVGHAFQEVTDWHKRHPVI